jgi:SAM-dependent methyltransferase
MADARAAGIESPRVESITTCPACGGRGRKRVLGTARAPISIVRCMACRHVYATGRYVHAFLDESYYGDRAEARKPELAAPPDDGQRFMRARKRRQLALYDELSNGAVFGVAPDGHALDVGCNVGVLLDELAMLGWHTEGIERAPAARDLAAQRHAVHDVDIESDAMLPRRYQLVTMTHVLEHLDRPMQGLKFVARHLAPGGTAIIEVPNWDDPARIFWRTRYRPLELGDHVSFFERGTLGALAERAGLRVHRWWSSPQGATVVMPSLLTATDLLAGLVRRRATPGVAAARLPTQSLPGGTRRRVLELLDRMDPWIASLAGDDAHWGANLVAVLRRPHASG